MIAVKSSPLPYIDALLPKDQDLDAQEVDFYHTSSVAPETYSQGQISNMDSASSGSAFLGGSTTISDMSIMDSTQGLQSQDSLDDTIDNPYLRAVRVPKKTKR